MPALQGNLFSGGPADRERAATLLEGERFRLEHIASHGHASPADFWYDQDQDEWVALLQGEAELVFSDAPRVYMRRGDILLIEAGCRHRVARVSKDAVWLALHHPGADS